MCRFIRDPYVEQDSSLREEIKSFNPFPNKTFRLFQTENNFKCDKNGRKFFKQVEITVGKGEIACYMQFLLLPEGFQKTCIVDT